jgi:hypothetical protein
MQGAAQHKPLCMTGADNTLPSAQKKTRRKQGFFDRKQIQLGSLQLGFLVHHMLASLGIVFLDFDLFRRRLLVLGRGIEMAGTGAGFEFDFFAHFRVP